MRCTDIDKCFEQISDYFAGENTGNFFLVNTENYDVYHKILERLQADNSKKCIYVSENCLPNGLPDVDSSISKTVDVGSHILIGLSPAHHHLKYP